MHMFDDRIDGSIGVGQSHTSPTNQLTPHTHTPKSPPVPLTDNQNKTKQGSFYTIRRAQDIACTIKLRGCCCCGETDPVPGT